MVKESAAGRREGGDEGVAHGASNGKETEVVKMDGDHALRISAMRCDANK